MHRPLVRVVFALIMTGATAVAWAQHGGSGIYTCVDAKGRRLTSDRPIPECLDREQKQLNASGTVRRVVPPSMTPAERAAAQERERQANEEKQRQADEKRRQKALLARYPDQARHDAERAKALQAVEDVIASARHRIVELQAERRKLDTEAEFYKDRSKWPLKLRRQVEDNDQQTAAQQRFIAAQEEEKRRIDAQFDQELAQLKVLWAQAAGTAAASGTPVRR